MNRLAGKRALITGGTSGIGLETAQRFVAEGADVLVTGVTPASIDRARQILGDKVPVVQADARDLNAQRGLAKQVREHFGQLDVAFLNAGVSDWRPFEDHTEDSYDRLFDINVKSVFFLTQALVPVLADSSSVILNASNSAHGGYGNSNAYAATKAAVSSLMRSWNADLLRSHGIRFNAVSPGPVNTPLYSAAKLGIEDLAQQTAVLETISSGIPLERMGMPGEIAEAVVYLASDASAFVVGQDLILDGGQTVL
ncbi:SDR family oxidoreductase [Streptomyces sp. 3214.6]|uniref:SDR family oxidoreductase n=1 Tax=Streptomyces sp. 3214.6 TaxID=1882757 RepID=UPI00090BB87F|nr:SDR family oxidoreductase [Streptomyces sp. 3214.6]SHH52257.1 NAD(P)-dependent dehydrogenase, short-chain alcohol dehydrogenase family [Streptomyces sp. 3214.6]